jgi:hypothetical protein
VIVSVPSAQFTLSEAEGLGTSLESVWQIILKLRREFR